MAGLWLSYGPSMDTLGNEHRNHCGSVSPILWGKKTYSVTYIYVYRYSLCKSKQAKIMGKYLQTSFMIIPHFSKGSVLSLNYWRTYLPGGKTQAGLAWGQKCNHCRVQWSSRVCWHGATEKQPYKFHIQADKTKSYCNVPYQLEGRAQQPPVRSIAFMYSWKS